MISFWFIWIWFPGFICIVCFQTFLGYKNHRAESVIWWWWVNRHNLGTKWRKSISSSYLNYSSWKLEHDDLIAQNNKCFEKIFNINWISAQLANLQSLSLVLLGGPFCFHFMSTMLPPSFRARFASNAHALWTKHEITSP